jgi:hypothetical protein
MALHLVKLCVGCGSVADLEEWIAFRLKEKRRARQPAEQTHTTRMVPKRTAELLDGGSLYWVVKGTIQCRQKLLAIRPFVDGEGIGRCDLVLEPIVIRTLPRPMRAFQGWRYYPAADAPADLAAAAKGAADMPETMRRELAQLGLL